MAKIMELEQNGEDYVAKVLIYGRIHEFRAPKIAKIVEKILHLDKHSNPESVALDLLLNYQIE